MGNAQSVSSPRRPQHRFIRANNLTASSSTIVLKRRNSPVIDGTATQPVEHGEDLVDTEDGAVLGKEQTPRQKRMSLSIFRRKSAPSRSESLVGHESTCNLEESSSNLQNSGGKGRSVSRSNSMVFEKLTDPKYATEASKRPVARRARMSLQHVPTSLKARLSLVREIQSPATDHFASFGCAQDNHSQANVLPERPGATPFDCAAIRRRSLTQHGVATRSEATCKHRGPVIQTSSCAESHPKKMSPPLASLVALSTPLEVGPRTETPIEFSHLGAFRLGTLRIMNGNASPPASLKSFRGDDCSSLYGETSPDILEAPFRNQTYSVPLQPKRAWERAPSPWEAETCNSRTALSVHVPDPSLALFRFNDGPSAASHKVLEHEQKDTALSPFSFGPFPGTFLNVESKGKHTAVGDDLFEAEPRSPTRNSEDSAYQRTSLHYDAKQKGDPPPNQLSKADSGYSSTISLRSLDRDRLPKASPQAIVGEFEMPFNPQIGHPNHVGGLSYPLPAHSDHHIEKLGREPRSVATAAANTRHETRSSIPLVGAQTVTHTRYDTHLRSHKRQQSLPSDVELTVNLPTKDSLSETGQNHYASRWRILRKRSSQTVQPQKAIFVTQAEPSAANSLGIPPVPPQTKNNLRARVEEFPNVCHLNTAPRGEHPGMLICDVAPRISTENLTGRWSEPSHTPSQILLPTVVACEQNHLGREDCSRKYSRAGHAHVQRSETFQPRSSLPVKSPIPWSGNEDFFSNPTSFDGVSSSLGCSSSPDAVRHAASTDPLADLADVMAKAMTAQLDASAALRFARAREEHLATPPPQSSPRERGHEPLPLKENLPPHRGPAVLNLTAASSTPNLHHHMLSAPFVHRAWRNSPPLNMASWWTPPTETVSTPGTLSIQGLGTTPASYLNTSTQAINSAPAPRRGAARPISAEEWAARASYWRSQREMAAQGNEQLLPGRRSADNSRNARAPLQRPIQVG